MEGDVLLYYTIEDYIGDYIIDHLYLGQKQTYDDCRSTAHQIGGKNTVFLNFLTKIKNLFSDLLSDFEFLIKNHLF